MLDLDRPLLYLSSLSPVAERYVLESVQARKQTVKLIQQEERKYTPVEISNNKQGLVVCCIEERAHFEYHQQFCSFEVHAILWVYIRATVGRHTP